MDYNVDLEEFQGPLDVLLHLIKEDNIDIYDISIDRITKQYLDYINNLEMLNINIGANYLVMVSILMEIKSNSLLPKKELEQDNEEIMTKETLINKLVEYKKYKDICADFKDLESLRNNIYIKSPENIKLYIDENIKDMDVTIDDLLTTYQKYLERKLLTKPLNTKVTNKEYSVKDRKKNIREMLQTHGKMEFSELFQEYNKSYIVVSFLSILELSKEDEINIEQENNFADIFIEMKVK